MKPGKRVHRLCMLLELLILLFFGSIQAQDIKKIKISELAILIQQTKSPLVVNFWATWCKPCIEEIPYFIKEVQAYNTGLKGSTDSIRLLLVSMDFKEAYPEHLQAFIQKRKYNASVLWLDETNADFFCPKIDSGWSGSIPATLFVNPQNRYRKFFEKQLSHNELKKEMERMGL